MTCVLTQIPRMQLAALTHSTTQPLTSQTEVVVVVVMTMTMMILQQEDVLKSNAGEENTQYV